MSANQYKPCTDLANSEDRILIWHGPTLCAICTERRVEYIEAENIALKNALRLVLPMAKGYAAEHRVGSNAEYVLAAEEILVEVDKP